MSHIGVEAADRVGDARVVQIYPRLSHDFSYKHCPLQLGAGDTVETVIHNAVVTLGLNAKQSYCLIEVREVGGEERTLAPEETPLDRVRLWPPETQKWHPKNQGYYFVLQYQTQPGGAVAAIIGDDNDDLCSLTTLTEEKVVEALGQRFHKRKIYTYAGNILIAINPNKFLPVYYNPKYVKMYENQPLGSLSPHIFAVADVAYRTMLNKRQNQCVVISGRSGSGKTESSSYLIHFLTALSQRTYLSGLERIILGAGPVLEAFGNANTATNNNSSCFGKFMQLNYLENGVIRGAVVQTYLLEKCRLVCRERRESNFHVFYYLLVGASKEEREEFQLLELQDYYYLKQENLQLDDVEKLAQEYKRLLRAMEMVGFLAPTKKQIFSILSAILHLGNLAFSESEDGGVLEVGPAEVLSTVSDLLRVKEELLVEALTKRRLMMGKEDVIYQYTLQEAITARDSMAKSLYSALFDWITLHINHALLKRRDMEDSLSCLSFGILDMFGFENLLTNSFEQLCINYTSERLQHFMNQHIFKLEQDEYESEGIAWHHIDYSDNTGCIQLISAPCTGIFHMLDEESNLPHATDDALLEKMKLQCHDNTYFEAAVDTERVFVIQHRAGRIKYHVKDFIERNRDCIRPEFVSVLRRSERAFLHHLVASSPVAQFRWGILRSTIHIIAVFKQMRRQRAQQGSQKRVSLKTIRDRRHKSAVNRLSSNSWTLDFSFDRSDECPINVFEDIFSSAESRKKSRAGHHKQLIPKNLVDLSSMKHVVGLTRYYQATSTLPKKKARTRSARLQASFSKLLETLEKAEPSFICCIRSTDEKKEMHFDYKYVLQQIKYTDMVQMVQIQKWGYSAKYTFKDFVERFRMLFPKGSAATPANITKLLERMHLDQSTYQIGKTKVFLKEKQNQLLQATLNQTVMHHIITLQRWFRSCLIRSHFLQKRDAATLIQRSWREFYEKQNRAATVIQLAWRGSQKRSNYENQQEGDKKTTKHRVGRESSINKRGLRRQQGTELSPSRGQLPAEGSRSREREDRGSPPHLTRPYSVPLDSKVFGDEGSSSPTQASSLQRYGKMEGIKHRADQWRIKREQTDDSSPEPQQKERQKGRSLAKGKSASVDELSKVSTSDSDSSPTSQEVRVRLRKLQKRKRRLAFARSGLVMNLGSTKESEYWSFPLPPISPHAPSLKNSASSVDVRAYKFKGKQRPAEPDGLRYSLPVSSNEGSVRHADSHSHPSTPERLWFIGRLLRRRPPRSPQVSDSSPEKSSTLPRYSPQSYQLPKQNSEDLRHNPSRRISRATRVSDSLDREITSTNELRNLDEFLGNQVYDLHSRTNELSPTESIFLTATMQFRETIKSMYSVPKPQIGYKDLMKGYQNKVNSLAGPKQKAEVSLVINLFQSVLDGFIRGEIKRVDSEPVKATKKSKKRRKKEKCTENPLGHMFSTYQVNIMQSCDLCGSYIWGMEKAYMCSTCKLICHKKCLSKVITDCSTRCDRQDENTPGSLHFGVQVCVLTSKANPVPKVVELLLMHVEMNGLYIEGIYRKSGSAGRARELHQIMETDPESATLENYPIHTVTGLVKRWLRELPDPLMTFSLYGDFLRAVELPERSERIKAVYQKIDELPPSNFNTLERLIFHLVKVAKEEAQNKMSPNSLAIVFAPCILRSPDTTDPFLGMKDVPRTTLCVEILITEQLRRYKEKMQNIQVLEHAQAIAINQLKLRRQNTIVEKASELDSQVETGSDTETEKALIERIKSIRQEKEDLACRLPDLEQENSDDDNLDSEWSVSSESLEHQRSQDSEGKGIGLMRRRQRPNCPPKPPDLGQRMKTMMAEIGAKDYQHGHNTGPEEEMIFAPAEDYKPLHAYKIFNGSMDDLDIPYIDEDA